MFYSHEILTSPEHGVATVWLVATLGSRSIARKLNRKAILDVDVPKACDVIINPEAPMALRLQGSMLYGVSRVYNQQCGYTLTDVQTMHDKMRSMLKAMPGGGLDPTAGKAKPDQLVLPDDPTFLPEINITGFTYDISSSTTQPESQQASPLWTRTSDLSQLTSPQNGSLRLSIPSDDIVQGVAGVGSESDVGNSAQKKGLFDRNMASLADEEGVLLQADFEFDEDGNIVELGPKQQHSTQAHGGRANEYASEAQLMSDVKESGNMDALPLEPQEPQPMPMDEDIGIVPDNGDERDPSYLPNVESASRSRPRGSDVTDNTGETVVRQRASKAVKRLQLDGPTGLRNTDLARWNNEYLQNMEAASKQKLQNKLPAQARKNAAFWVFGQGIGSVGSIGAPGKETRRRGRKRGHATDEGDNSDVEGRNVRARLEDEEQVGRGGSVQPMNADDFMQDDVQDFEIGRQGPPALHDENSSQMPWNITASIQSSRQGSSLLAPFRGFGGIDDRSSQGLPGSTGFRELPGLGRPWSRLTSASPLAGRGPHFDSTMQDKLNNFLGSDESDDIDMLGGFDLDYGLQSEREETAETPFKTPRRSTSASNRQLAAKINILSSTLDQESLNFLEFLKTQIETTKVVNAEGIQGSEQKTSVSKGKQALRRLPHENEIALSALLPPKKTSRVVATHGLMHVLTLATKGVLEVHQDEAREDRRNEDYGTAYHYGEIFLHPLGM